MAKITFRDLILFEDEDYLCINKPAGISSLEDRNDKYNILQMSRNYHPDASLCHRLDKDTSGVLLIAKNEEAYRHASLQFEHRTVKKIYHAMIFGTRQFEEVNLDQPLVITGRGIVKVDAKKGKEALTIVNTFRTFRHFSLLECQLETGRKHQIRVHLAHAGFPIVGDLQYGGEWYTLAQIKKKYNPRGDASQSNLISRVALHAHSLQFKTISEELEIISAPYPNDFAVMLKILEKYDV